MRVFAGTGSPAHSGGTSHHTAASGRPDGREINISFDGLGKTLPRPFYFGMCQGSQNPVSTRTSAIIAKDNSGFGCGPGKDHIGGGSENVTKERYRKSDLSPKRVCVKFVSCTKKDGGHEASHQPQTTERVNSQRKVQDGNTQCSIEVNEERRLSGIARFERRVLLDSHSGKSPQISQIYLEEPEVPVSLPPFGLTSAPRVFTKVLKPVVANLRRQGIRIVIYLDDILIIASSRDECIRHLNIAITLLISLRFYYQQGKIMFGAVTRDSISRFHSELPIHVSENRNRQVQRHSREMQGSTSQRQVINSPSVKYHRTVEVGLASDSADQSVLQTPAGGPNRGTGQK